MNRTNETSENRSCCNPESVFELVDGGLNPSRRNEVLRHLKFCGACSSRYEREKRLSQNLLAPPEREDREKVYAGREIAREVALSIPTRSAKARGAWALVAFGILLLAAGELSLTGNSPFVFAAQTLDVFWGAASGIADISTMLVAFIAPLMILALIVGAVLDLLIAGAVVTAIRRGANHARRV